MARKNDDTIMFYHGSSTSAGIDFMLVPPTESGIISEKGRKKNLNRVFFTHDFGLAKIYAGRAARSIGGNPVVYRVIAPVDIQCMNNTEGASVYHAAWAFCERI
jgi:hypothetical protein